MTINTQELLNKYCPSVYFHSKDIFLPSGVELFWEYTQIEKEGVKVADANAANLNAHSSSSNYLGWINQAEFMAHCAIGVPAGPQGSDSPMYAHVKTVGDFVYLSYAFFYPYNGQQTLYLDYLHESDEYQNSATWKPFAEHLGDWEHVTIKLHKDTEEFEEAYFAAHGDGEWVKKNDPRLHFESGTHLRVLSALDSHASYPAIPDPGSHGEGRISVNTVNLINELPKIIEIIEERAYHIKMKVLDFVDIVDDKGAFWKPWELGNDVVELTDQPWLNFAGDWGNPLIAKIDNSKVPPDKQPHAPPYVTRLNIEAPELIYSDEQFHGKIADMLLGLSQVGAFLGVLGADYLLKHGPTGPLQSGWWDHPDTEGKS